MDKMTTAELVEAERQEKMPIEDELLAIMHEADAKFDADTVTEQQFIRDALHAHKRRLDEVCQNILKTASARVATQTKKYEKIQNKYETMFWKMPGVVKAKAELDKHLAPFKAEFNIKNDEISEKYDALIKENKANENN